LDGIGLIIQEFRFIIPALMPLWNEVRYGKLHRIAGVRRTMLSFSR